MTAYMGMGKETTKEYLLIYTKLYTFKVFWYEQEVR